MERSTGTKTAFRCATALAMAALLIGLEQGHAQSVPHRADNRVRVLTNEVILPVTVTDSSGEFVLDLSQTDFHVFDDGVEQTIDHWDLGGDPLAVALVIQTSARPNAMISEIHSLASIFTETCMALDGAAAVITYDSTVEVRQSFTTDHDAAARAISDVSLGNSGMRLYDAMAQAVEMLKDEVMRRRVMLIIGESRDKGSTAKFAAVVRDAQWANISIYAVGPSSVARDLLQDAPNLWAAPAIFLLQQGMNRSKSHDLEIAAAATGGIHYSGSRGSTLREATDRIGGELHAQYIIGYQPNAERDPGFHAVVVRTSRPEVMVRTRPGYYVAQSQQ
jgi:Ca-activated chloride channel homolog